LFLINIADPPGALDVNLSELLVSGLGIAEPTPAVVVQTVIGRF
jgi:hypothetical protein